MMKTKKMLVGAVIYAVCGMMFEVFFTGLGSGPKRSFHGGVSLLMGLLYVAVYLFSPLLFRLIDRTGLRHVLLRAIPITVLIYAFEWAFGELCNVCGFRPWGYAFGMWSGLTGGSVTPALFQEWWNAAVKWVIAVSHGNITLDMLPIWLPYAIVIEPTLKIIANISDHLCSGNLLTWRGFWGLVGNTYAEKAQRDKGT